MTKLSETHGETSDLALQFVRIMPFWALENGKLTATTATAAMAGSDALIFDPVRAAQWRLTDETLAEPDPDAICGALKAALRDLAEPLSQAAKVGPILDRPRFDACVCETMGTNVSAALDGQVRSRRESDEGRRARQALAATLEEDLAAKIGFLADVSDAATHALTALKDGAATQTYLAKLEVVTDLLQRSLDDPITSPANFGRIEALRSAALLSPEASVAAAFRPLFERVRPAVEASYLLGAELADALKGCDAPRLLDRHLALLAELREPLAPYRPSLSTLSSSVGGTVSIGFGVAALFVMVFLLASGMSTDGLGATQMSALLAVLPL